MKSYIKPILQHPLTIFVSLFAGLAVGIYFPKIGTALEPYGNMYLKLLEFTLVPIIAASVTLSISKLLSQNDHSHSPRRLIMTMLLFMLLIGAISVLFSFSLKPAISNGIIAPIGILNGSKTMVSTPSVAIPVVPVVLNPAKVNKKTIRRN